MTSLNSHLHEPLYDAGDEEGPVVSDEAEVMTLVVAGEEKRWVGAGVLVKGVGGHGGGQQVIERAAESDRDLQHKKEE